MPSVDYTRPKITSNANSSVQDFGGQAQFAREGLLERTILRPSASNWAVHVAVILVASAVYLACIVSPPSLQDDVDAVQAQIARNMITSGDWVTPRLDGVIYLEKATADLLADRR